MARGSSDQASVALVADGVEHDALAERPLRDGQRLELELLHRGREEHRAGNHEVDPAGVESRPCGAVRTPLAPRMSLYNGSSSSRVMVSWFSDAGRLLVAPRRHHLCEALERAAAPHRELRREGLDLLARRRELLHDPIMQRPAVALRERIRVHELGREARDAEREAGGPLHPARVADHDLEASSAEVEAHRGRRIEHHGRADRAEDQSRLLVAADDIDDDAGFLPDAVDELGAVRGAADRARGLREGLGRVRGVGEHAEPANRGDGLVGGGGRDVPVAAHDVAEAQHLLLAHQGVEMAVGVDVGDEQVKRVRPEVHGCHAHEDAG